MKSYRVTLELTDEDLKYLDTDLAPEDKDIIALLRDFGKVVKGTETRAAHDKDSNLD